MSLRRVNYERVSAWKPGNHGPSTLVKVRGYGLLDSGCGSRDDVSVFKEGEDVYVLSISLGLPYVGVAVFSKTSEEKSYDSGTRVGAGDVRAKQPDRDFFAQGSEQCEELLGADWEDVSEADLVKRAAEYLYL